MREKGRGWGGVVDLLEGHTKALNEIRVILFLQGQIITKKNR